MSLLMYGVVGILGLVLLTCFAGGMFWVQIGHPRDWLEERLPGRLTWRMRAPCRPTADTSDFVQRSGFIERGQRRRSA